MQIHEPGQNRRRRRNSGSIRDNSGFAPRGRIPEGRQANAKITRSFALCRPRRRSAPEARLGLASHSSAPSRSRRSALKRLPARRRRVSRRIQPPPEPRRHGPQAGTQGESRGRPGKRVKTRARRRNCAGKRREQPQAGERAPLLPSGEGPGMREPGRHRFITRLVRRRVPSSGAFSRRRRPPRRKGRLGRMTRPLAKRCDSAPAWAEFYAGRLGSAAGQDPTLGV
jgi:hypothetical protein